MKMPLAASAGDRQKAVEEIRRALRVAGRGEDRAVVRLKIETRAPLFRFRYCNAACVSRLHIDRERRMEKKPFPV